MTENTIENMIEMKTITNQEKLDLAEGMYLIALQISRDILGYDHMDTLDKLYPENSKIGYNKFTPCLPLMNTNFVTACSDVLHSDYNKTLADQILGYDCNPGYGRAKCIHSKDKVSGMVSYDMSNISNLSSAANSNVNCNC